MQNSAKSNAQLPVYLYVQEVPSLHTLKRTLRLERSDSCPSRSQKTRPQGIQMLHPSVEGLPSRV